MTARTDAAITGSSAFIARIAELEAINADLLAALSGVVDFCDEPNGSGTPEALLETLEGLYRRLPAARAALKAKARRPA